MTIRSATRAALRELGPAVVNTVEGQRALNLAAILDDRAGIQSGGVASTDKQLGALMTEIRDRYQPKGASGLELLRGGRSA